MALSVLEEETLNFWKRLIVGVKVTIDGTVHDYPIHPSSYIEGYTLKLFAEISEEDGLITHAYAYDQNGRVIREKPLNIQKGLDGLMVAFVLSVEIKEAVNFG